MLFKVDDLKLLIQHVQDTWLGEIEHLKSEVDFLYAVKKSNRQLKVWIHQQLAQLDGELEEVDD
jgi:hypothetical protein